MLLALSLLLRVADLAAIDFKSIVWSENDVAFTLSCPRKSQHQGSLKVFNLKKLSNNKKLCPVECLQQYIQVTRKRRNGEADETLFICSKRPFGKASKATIGGGIKSVLLFAGIDITIFSVHSTPGALASMAEAKGVSSAILMRAAGWTSKSIFTEFYHWRIENLEVPEAFPE